MIQKNRKENVFFKKSLFQASSEKRANRQTTPIY